MSKKRFLLVLLTSLALIFTVFAGCSKKQTPSKPSTPPTVESYESVESESEVESEPESEEVSESESEEVSIPDNISAPTFSFSLTPTINSLILNVEEDDPYDVGHITAMSVKNGKETTSIEDVDTRVIEGLYSGKQYLVTVTYTYDIGDGPVSKDYKQQRYTVAVKVPTIEISSTAISESSLGFEFAINDPHNVLNITSIGLTTLEGEEVTELEDLTQRVFEEIPSGQYLLVVNYEYDLNKGEGVVKTSTTAMVATVISPLILPDFIVEVPEGRNPVILQISDTQIIDASQARPGDTGTSSYYAPSKMEDRLFKFMRETINATEPDLILITGDLVYGKYDDKGSSLLALINIMESFQIPWAPIFGNHDNESRMGVDWQCQQLENAEYCLFKQRTLSGNGNYTVGIAQGGKLTRVFFMMDTNGCGEASPESLVNGHTYNNFVGFKDDQVNWFMEVGAQIKEISPDTKFSFAFHIQIYEFKNAFAKYGFTNSGAKENPISIDWHPNKEDGDFGYIGANLKGAWDTNNVVFNKMVSLGVDSIYVGHEHNINASVVHNGIRFQFSQKIGTYDRCNWLLPDGNILSSYPEPANAKELMGGTVNVLDETGAIVDAYVYYCGGLDPTKPPIPPLEVNGLQAGTTESSDMWADGNLSIERVTFDGHNSYKVTAVGQGKFFVNKKYLKNKNTFSFTIYVPSTSTALLGGYGEFAIRVKPNDKEPTIDSATDGYIKFMSKKNKPDVLPGLEIIFDQWVTYNIDVSSLGESCTEWALLFPAGNVAYVRDVVVA